MVELKVLTMIFVGPGRPAVLVLEPQEERLPGKSRIVPIWIGAPEAMQIGVALENIKPPRPFTHDLFLDALTNLDSRIDHAVICDSVGETFFAKLYLRQAGRLIELDARPTDAIALAIREDAPIYIEDHLLDMKSYPFIFKEEADREMELKKFHTFVEGLDPEDLL